MCYKTNSLRWTPCLIYTLWKSLFLNLLHLSRLRIFFLYTKYDGLIRSNKTYRLVSNNVYDFEANLKSGKRQTVTTNFKESVPTLTSFNEEIPLLEILEQRPSMTLNTRV